MIERCKPEYPSRRPLVLPEGCPCEDYYPGMEAVQEGQHVMHVRLLGQHVMLTRLLVPGQPISIPAESLNEDSQISLEIEQPDGTLLVFEGHKRFTFRILPYCE